MGRKLTCAVVLFLFMLAQSAGMSLPVHAQAQSYGYINFSPVSANARPGGTVLLQVTGASSGGGAISIAVPAPLVVAADATCAGDCFGADTTRKNDGTFIDTQIGNSVATVSFFATIPDTAIAGASYTVTAMLLGGPRAVEYASSFIVVGSPPDSSSAPSTEEPATISTMISPDASRVTSDGSADFLVQPIITGTTATLDFVLEIQLPPSLVMSAGPFCESPSASPHRTTLCDYTTSAVNGGRIIFRISISAGRYRGEGVYFTVKSNGSAPASFSQIISSVQSDELGTFEVRGLEYANVMLVDSGELFVGNRSVPGGLVEIASGYKTSEAGCSSDRFFPGKTLLVRPWAGQGEDLTVVLGQGHIAEATTGVATDSCFLPFSALGAERDTVYVLMDGDCRSCFLGILLWGEGSDPVLQYPPTP